MDNEYQYLLRRYSNIISNLSPEYILLIERRKRHFNSEVYLDLEYIKATKEYITVLNINEICGFNKLDFVVSNKKYSNFLLSYIIDFLTSSDE